MGISLSPQEQFEIFGTDKVGGEYAQEAEQRWGDTDAWAQSQRRTAAYTKDDWREIKAEADAITQDFAQALTKGVPATAPEAAAIAERHRRHITELLLRLLTVDARVSCRDVRRRLAFRGDLRGGGTRVGAVRPGRDRGRHGVPHRLTSAAPAGMVR